MQAKSLSSYRRRRFKNILRKREPGRQNAPLCHFALHFGIRESKRKVKQRTAFPYSGFLFI